MDTNSVIYEMDDAQEAPFYEQDVKSDDDMRRWSSSWARWFYFPLSKNLGSCKQDVDGVYYELFSHGILTKNIGASLLVIISKGGISNLKGF